MKLNGSYKYTSMPIKDVLKDFNFIENSDNAVYGMGGKLILQPDYQRNYIYGEGKDIGRDIKVIESILQGSCIGLIHFNTLNNCKQEYDLLDGQQRLISIGRFLSAKFSVDIDGNPFYFHNLSEELKENFENYNLQINIHTGDAQYIKKQFETINEAGTPVNNQELLNCVYSGPFVSELKKIYSNKNSEEHLAEFYIKGLVNRQEILAEVLDWISKKYEISAEEYMSRNQMNPAAVMDVKNYVDSVIEWSENVFDGIEWPALKKLTKGQPWNKFYEKYKNQYYNPEKNQEIIQRLLADEAVQNKKGIFEYVLGGCEDAKLLEVRIFDDVTKRAAWHKQTEEAKISGKSNCSHCFLGHENNKNKIWSLDQMEADHVTAWSKGGATNFENCEMLCIAHNRAKGNK